MPSINKTFPCFWCYSVPCGLYNACLEMLIPRSLAIVFDLDETLIVANTMKSFDDRIEALMVWIDRENDPIREAGMTAEMKRYVEDRTLLKQYAETDCVVDCGKVYNMQLEEFILQTNENLRVVRPVVRLPEKNIVFTRINPENRDTSVLVKLRPAWDEFKSHLTAKDRKRFEVFVCTMAERDYALEMWRLLDPEAHLISAEQLGDRIVCVKPGARKSLMNVFEDSNCHPRMALVIDDRVKVWEDKDQPRVHVVPAFIPYYAPQAETASSLAVLCVAKNVACNVRSCFFKEFDENLLWRISGIFYEDEIVNLPNPPDINNYLVSEDPSFIPNGNPNLPIVEGKNAPEVIQRLRSMDVKAVNNGVYQTWSNNSTGLKPETSKVSVAAVSSYTDPASTRVPLPSEKPSLLGDPFRRESRSRPNESPLLSKLSLHAQRMQSSGGWLVEKDTDTRHSTTRDSGALQQPDPRPAGLKNSIKNATSYSSPVVQPHTSQPRNGQANIRVNGQGQCSSIPAGFGAFSNQPSSDTRELIDVDRINTLQSLYISVLQEIGSRCNSKVEFNVVFRTDEDLPFSAEVFFTGEKIGAGTGKTKKDAQLQAADNALQNLASGYISHMAPHCATVRDHSDERALGNEHRFVWDIVTPRSEELVVNNGFFKKHTSEG